MNENEQLSFDFEPRPTIKGFPELRWTGKVRIVPHSIIQPS